MQFFENCWRNVQGVCVIWTHATQTKEIHNIFPRSNNSFRSSLNFAPLQTVSSQATDGWYYSGRSFGNYFFSLCFSFVQDWEILGPVCHTSKQLAALWSCWEIMTRSLLWRNNVLRQHGIDCWLCSHWSEEAERSRSWLQVNYFQDRTRVLWPWSWCNK